MTNEEIELFVDRMCGYWPTTNIARNTVKSTWRQSMPLRSLTIKDARIMLEKIKTMPGFPALSTVEQMAQKVLGWGEHKGPCNYCEGNLWIEVRSPDEYQQYLKCPCIGGSRQAIDSAGGKYDRNEGLPDVNIRLVKQLMADEGIGLIEALRRVA